MTVELQAPYAAPTTVTLLPNPVFSDSEGLDVTVDYKESMNGTRHSYVTNPGTTKLTYEFQNMGRGKMLEIQEFLIAYIGEEIRLRNFKDEVWKVFITSDPHTFAHDQLSVASGGPRQESGNFTLEFTGVKISG